MLCAAAWRGGCGAGVRVASRLWCCSRWPLVRSSLLFALRPLLFAQITSPRTIAALACQDSLQNV